MEAQPSSGPSRRFLPAALATLVIGTAGVFILLMLIPPSAATPSATLGRSDAPSREANGDPTAASELDRRRLFTSPPTPSAQDGAENDRETKAEGFAGPALSGRVIDRDSRPISGATVQLARTGADGPRNARALTDGDGGFVLQSLSAGTWRVAVTAAGYRPRAVPVEVPRADELELVLEHDKGLELTVTDSTGAPLEGARVALSVRSLSLPGRRSGSTTAEGRLTLHGILASGPEWSGRLTVKHPEYPPLERSITPEDLERGELRIVLETGGELRLRIVSAEGAPVSGAIVTAFRDEAEDSRWLRSVSSGEVHFRTLSPGDYTVSVTTNRDGQATVAGLAVAAGPAAGAREIMLERGGGSVTVRAVAHDGSPVPLCRVRLTPSNAAEPRGAARDGVTGEEGVCRFESLPDARYDVEVGGGAFTLAREAAVPADGRELVIQVDRPGSIAGRVEHPRVTGGYAIRVSTSLTAGGGQRSYERIARFSALRSGFTVRHLPPGAYTVDLLVGEETVATIEGVEVGPGEKTEGVIFGATED